MLQQTQVARVIPAYARFLGRFPTLGSLARAPLADVLLEWSGLGYNRRARDLHRIARLSPGGLPRTVAALDALPGIGSYTASAVAGFAYRKRTAFADTNIRRVLGRSTVGRTATLSEALTLDARLQPPRAHAEWHHALMDIGALFCRSLKPRCGRCPLRALCAYDGTEDRSSRRQTPFASSDRRIRGAIVRALRGTTRGFGMVTLQRMIGDERVVRLVHVLAREGLVEVSDKGVRLPAH
jgi:A/G-specific adenine glycosylase